MRCLDHSFDGTLTKYDGRKRKVAYLVLEYCDHSDMLYQLNLTKKPFSEDLTRYYFKQLLEVGYYLLVNGVAHRDLKLQNVMFDKEYQLKVADFGLATRTASMDTKGYQTEKCGTHLYMAPEIQEGRKYKGWQVDLFALGVMLFNMYACESAFDKATRNDRLYKLFTQQRINEFWEIKEKTKKKGYFSPEFKDLVTNLLQYNPDLRLSYTDIIGHAWMKQENPNFSLINVKHEHIQRFLESKNIKVAKL
jgi:serine/threonine protein kinase